MSRWTDWYFRHDLKPPNTGSPHFWLRFKASPRGWNSLQWFVVGDWNLCCRSSLRTRTKQVHRIPCDFSMIILRWCPCLDFMIISICDQLLFPGKIFCWWNNNLACVFWSRFFIGWTSTCSCLMTKIPSNREFAPWNRPPLRVSRYSICELLHWMGNGLSLLFFRPILGFFLVFGVSLMFGCSWMQPVACFYLLVQKGLVYPRRKASRTGCWIRNSVRLVILTMG